ncbi:hypothetical protein MLD38_035661 [Melastoma candidum]|uniref:Uncharacterized protein n=1 Tax=Melastoma candidum TaxID=119954 RepID=A0ACB9LHB5_9MYRT|nr:hypothetical protein MLD38_035661 [Melastoma candidum]
MMDAKVAQSPQFSSWVRPNRIGCKPTGSLGLPRKFWDLERPEAFISSGFYPKRRSTYKRLIAVDVSCSYNNVPANAVQSGSLAVPTNVDGSMVLKSKSQEIEPYLSGRCIYLVGMMGSGKTTVGKILSQVLGYSFVDSDSLVEQEVEGKTVTDIFKLYGEGFFRKKETEILRRISIMPRAVVSTGGGVVIRPINWRYMHKGISVWLDVPLDALARRISAVGTHSRPLLHGESGDAYSKALTRLSSLLEERAEAYANANARVSLEDIAAKQGYRDVSFITPTAIAIEALEQIEHYLRDKEGIPFDTL